MSIIFELCPHSLFSGAKSSSADGEFYTLGSWSCIAYFKYIINCY